MSNRCFALGGLLMSAALLAGCANQLSQRSEHEERIDRRLLSHDLQIEAGEPAVLNTPRKSVRVLEQSRFEVSKYETSRRYDRYTPYQAWRELYEVPLGAVAVVAGVGANVLNVALLGSLPESATRGWVDYGVAGLNPAMNVESNGRSQQNLAALDEKLLDRREEYIALPWADKPVTVSANGKDYALTTDRRGILRLDLLEGPFADDTLESLSTITLHVAAEDGTQATTSLAVDRTLRGNLGEAHELVFADLEDGDVEQWVYRVRRLSELGLQEQASELEQSLVELTRNDPELQQTFLQQLREDTASPVSGAVR